MCELAAMYYRPCQKVDLRPPRTNWACYSSLCFAAKYPLAEPTRAWCSIGELGLEVDKPSLFMGVVGTLSDGVSISTVSLPMVVFS
jgi:hypothetical protein